MTDATKWKSIMLRADTYAMLKQIADRDRRKLASILNELVEKEWEWHFGTKTQSTTTLVKDPTRRVDTAAPKNPFLVKRT